VDRLPYGRTWWGKAWLDALTDRARLDLNRLIRGRSYARGDRVRDVHIEPGAIRALVQGSRAWPYAVTVTVPMFDDATWSKLLDTMAAEVGHLAALLDGELPAAIGTEQELLPGSGELGISCSCPDWAEPCKHAAAVCYLTADVLDVDPFALLLMRGRTKVEVVAALRDRRKPAWSAPAGMLAKDAYRRKPAPLPTLALPAGQPGQPTTLPVPPPAAAGVTARELTELAASAARRAWELLI
jgi:uncharacterized Zn finger protein